MADVYRFKVRLRELEDYIWRDIEITSVSTVAKLVYAILAAFEAEGSHLFCMKFGDERYEIVFDDFTGSFEFSKNYENLINKNREEDREEKKRKSFIDVILSSSVLPFIVIGIKTTLRLLHM